jgi:hypothetical protein
MVQLSEVGHTIMNGVIAYGRLEWEKTLQQVVKDPERV